MKVYSRLVSFPGQFITKEIIKGFRGTVNWVRPIFSLEELKMEISVLQGMELQSSGYHVTLWINVLVRQAPNTVSSRVPNIK
jgi:hypothetical protein